MIQFEKGPRLAAATILRHESTRDAVAFEYCATHGVRDARKRFSFFSITKFIRLATRLGKTLSLEIGNEQIQRALNDDREIPARVRMAHQITTELEFPAKRFARSELDRETPFRERLDGRLLPDSRRLVGSREPRRQENANVVLPFAGDGREYLFVVFFR